MNAVFEKLNPCNTVAVNRPLAHAVGLSEAVIYGALLAKCQYYTERDMLYAGEWFYSTAADLCESTALSERQQKRCIDKLIELGLIECRKMGMPAKRYFRIIEDADILESCINSGLERIREIKPDCSDIMYEQVQHKERDKSLQNVVTSSDEMSKHIYKSKENRSKDSNQELSIPLPQENKENEEAEEAEAADNGRETGGQTVHTNNSVDHSAVIKANIDYDWFYENRRTAGLCIDMPKVDEICSIMCDVVCSNRPTVRVNGEELPAERVKQRFLQLKGEHIEYVIDAMKNNPNEIRNIRAYLITALYNAPATMDSYYSEMARRE